MKVIYKDTVTEKVKKAILEAEYTGREISYIELDRPEMCIFKHETRTHSCLSPPFEITHFRGVRVQEQRRATHD